MQQIRYFLVSLVSKLIVSFVVYRPRNRLSAIMRLVCTENSELFRKLLDVLVAVQGLEPRTRGL
jgi:hypothetical protein